MTDIERMLRQLARARVEDAERQLQPVHPKLIAEDVIASRLNMIGVVARRYELVAAVADYVRELRARPGDNDGDGDA
jgi:hypothetical protein